MPLDVASVFQITSVFMSPQSLSITSIAHGLCCWIPSGFPFLEICSSSVKTNWDLHIMLLVPFPSCCRAFLSGSSLPRFEKWGSKKYYSSVLKHLFTGLPLTKYCTQVYMIIPDLIAEFTELASSRAGKCYRGLCGSLSFTNIISSSSSSSFSRKLRPNAGMEREMEITGTWGLSSNDHSLNRSDAAFSLWYSWSQSCPCTMLLSLFSC